MLQLTIPGRPALALGHLVLDYNGTLALDGRILVGVRERLEELAERLDVHIITADTFGLAAVETGGLPAELQVIGAGDQAGAKLEFVRRLGPQAVCAIGNGANDALMLKEAALGICVVGGEGAAVSSLIAADVAVRNITDALDLLLHPGRLAATLRI